MNRPLTCVYDAFRFGLWDHGPLYRAGVGRFIRALARELAGRGDVRLVLLSPAGLERDVARFLAADEALREVEFLCFEKKAGFAGRLKPLLVRGTNALFPPRLKTRLKNRFGGGLLAGYQTSRPAMRAALERLCGQGPTCYLSPYYDLPVWLEGVPGLLQAAYVHDVIPLRLPDLHLGDAGYARRMEGFARRADLLFTNSRFTRDDFLGLFPDVPRERMVVAPEGADAHFTPQPPEAISRVRRKYGIPDEAPYIQSLCTLEARKGLEDVLAAFARCRETTGAEDLRLVLSGGRGWGCEDILKRAGEHAGRVILTGFVDDEDVPALLSGCLCFAYMSRYEGFGLPPLEAMSCGAPVAAARATSLPEVVGDGGVLLEPGDRAGLAAVFVELLADPAKGAALRESGLRRARAFSWKRCADAIVDDVRRALEQRVRPGP